MHNSTPRLLYGVLCFVCIPITMHLVRTKIRNAKVEIQPVNYLRDAFSSVSFMITAAESICAIM
jgi:hypothetical protein